MNASQDFHWCTAEGRDPIQRVLVTRFFSPDKIDEFCIWRKGFPVNHPFTEWSDVNAARLSNLLQPDVQFFVGQFVTNKILSVRRNGRVQYWVSVGQRRNRDLSPHIRCRSVWKVLALKIPNRHRPE